MKSLTSRTTLITAVAVAGVLIAGTAAVAANIGILNASNDSSIGSLSATDDLLPSTTLDPGVPMVVERAAPAVATPASATTAASDASYVVDDAGTVSVSTTSGGLVLVDAAANPGWTPTATQPDPLSLRVAFDNGTRTVVFTATLGADGTIVADVTEPVIVAGATPNNPVAAPPNAATSYSDDDRYESDDDSYGESDDDSNGDRYESDDVSHEYEGAEDDD
jgi:hypothetical protein